MNNLHSLIDQASTYMMGLMPEVSDHDARTIYAMTADIGRQAQCFDIGAVDGVCELNVVPDLCRLPYQVCWFEGEIQGSDSLIVPRQGRLGLLAYEAGEGRVSIGCYMLVAGKWGMLFAVNLESLTSQTAVVIPGSADKDAAHKAVYAVKAFCSALNCTNVKRVEHAPSGKLQKARAKRGRSPLFSYWTLDLDLGKSREVGADLGGTHASPRVHLRRGHPRQYAPGKYCWVQPCVVGNKAAGMVHKDYAVRAA